jgi:chromosome segregation ATPase
MMHHIDSSLQNFDKSNAEAKKKQLEQLIENTESEIKKIETSVEESKSELQQLEKQQKEFDVESIENSVKLLNKLKKHLVEEKIKLKELETEYSSNLKKMEKLKDLKYNESCEFCMSNVFVKDAISTKDNIKTDEQKLEEKKEYIKQIEHNISVYTEEEDKQKSYAILENKINSNKMSALKLNMELNDVNNSKASHTKALEDINKNIELYIKQESAIKENLVHEEKMKEVKAKANRVKEKEKEIDEEYTKLQVQIAVINNKVAECESNIEKIKLFI